MVVVQSYPLAVVMCFVTMLCWGSWANTQKLASREWRFQLFYWDYALGVFLLALVLALTMGSFGATGRPFLADLAQADASAMGSAFLGGTVFNLGNILLVAAIDIAGMAVAFPIGVGLALVIGVVMTYVGAPIGHAGLLFLGVAGITGAIVLDAVAYRMLPSAGQKTTPKGIILSVASGLLLGVFYPFVARSMSIDFANLEPGRLGPYSAIVIASLGILLSSFPVEQHRHGQAVRRRARSVWRLLQERKPSAACDRDPRRSHLVPGLFTEHRCIRSRGLRDFLRPWTGRNHGGGGMGGVHLEGIQDRRLRGRIGCWA